ncbi:MAG: helix-turn-helix domain-containing protein [Gammaproteobacteria bacterium]
MKNQNSTTSQRNRLLNRLQKGQCSTFELRHRDDIPCVAARVYELRHNLGYNIQTHWIEDDNPGGGSHRVANYVLMPGKWQGGAQ